MRFFSAGGFLKTAFHLLFFALCAFPALVFGAPASPGVPLDSWIYPAIEKLAGFGLIDSGLQGSRPWTRLEAARLTAEAKAQAETEEVPPVAREILARLHREFASSLSELNGGAAESYFKPIREIRLDYLYQEGHPSAIAGSNIVARQFSLNTNNFGIDYKENNNFQAALESEARLGRFFLLDWRPLLLVDEAETDLTTLEGKAALALGPFEFSAGRQSLWWGQGRHGSLVLTNNAKPLDMVRITNPSPMLLPWIFKYLGPMRFDLFWSELNDYIADDVTGRGNEPYFGGLRMDFKPLPWLEIGASRAVIFGGDDIDVDTEDFVTILGGKNLSGDEDTSNNIAAIDLRLHLPFLWGAELYGEAGGEDEAGGWIANNAWLAGLYLPRLEPNGRLSLRLEHADLSIVDNNSPVWYRHGIYKSGYTYEGKILGHHVGGAAKDTFGELEILLPRDILLALSVDYEERGYDQPVKEEHVQPGVRLEWQPREHLSLMAHYTFDKVSNFGFVAGDDRNFYLGMVGVKLEL